MDRRVSARLMRAAMVVAIAVLLAINLVNAVARGGDFRSYHDGARRLLAGERLYAESRVAHGFVGPPAQALLFVPFAPLALLPARMAWFLVNVLLLWYAIAVWTRVLLPPRPHGATTGGAHRLMPPAASLLPLVAVARPLQSQFEHQNLNILLLALAACAAEALGRRRAATAGVSLGIAAAIKVYPALALLWLAARREWGALGWAALAVLVMTSAPVLMAGAQAGLADLQEWLAIAGAGWPLRRANQSLAALWGRLLVPDALCDGALLTRGQPVVLWLIGATALVLAAPLTAAIRRRMATPRQLASELACVNALAILLSPIAWEHYAVGYYPLFVILHDRWRTGVSARERWWACATLAIGVVGLTILSRGLLGAQAARAVRTLSIAAWTGLLVCLVTSALTAVRRNEPA